MTAWTIGERRLEDASLTSLLKMASFRVPDQVHARHIMRQTQDGYAPNVTVSPQWLAFKGWFIGPSPFQVLTVERYLELSVDPTYDYYAGIMPRSMFELAQDIEATCSNVTLEIQAGDNVAWLIVWRGREAIILGGWYRADTNLPSLEIRLE